MNDVIAGRIRAALESRSMSQAELASRVGVTKAAVTGWLQTGRVTLDNLAAVADALGVSVSYLMGAENPQGVPVLGNIHEIGTEVLGRLDVPAADRKAYAVEVVNGEMDPRYRAGEFLLIYPTAPPGPGDDCLLAITGEPGCEVVSMVSEGPDGIYVAPVLGGARRFVPTSRLACLHLVAGAFRAGARRPPS